MLANFIRKTNSPSWTLVDIVAVSLCILFATAIIYIPTSVLFANKKATFIFGRYLISLLTIFFTVFWIRKRYGLLKDALGLRKGKYSILSYVVAGVVIGIIYFLLLQLTPMRESSGSADQKISPSILTLIVLPLSVSGFASIILTPVGEEIFVRGFLYGYLRGKIGVYPGLILQAVLFSLLHTDYISGADLTLMSFRFLTGLILGILYEVTESIYPSIICHGTLNYLASVFNLFRM